MLAFAASTQYLRHAVQESTKSMLGEQLESVSKYAALLALHHYSLEHLFFFTIASQSSWTCLANNAEDGGGRSLGGRGTH